MNANIKIGKMVTNNEFYCQLDLSDKYGNWRKFNRTVRDRTELATDISINELIADEPVIGFLRSI